MVQRNSPYIGMLNLGGAGSECAIDSTRHEQHRYALRDAWILRPSSENDRSVHVAASCDVGGEVVSQLLEFEFPCSNTFRVFQMALEMARAHNKGLQNHIHDPLATQRRLRSDTSDFQRSLSLRTQAAGINLIVRGGKAWPHAPDEDNAVVASSALVGERLATLHVEAYTRVLEVRRRFGKILGIPQNQLAFVNSAGSTIPDGISVSQINSMQDVAMISHSVSQPKRVISLLYLPAKAEPSKNNVERIVAGIAVASAGGAASAHERVSVGAELIGDC